MKGHPYKLIFGKIDWSYKKVEDQATKWFDIWTKSY